MSQTLSENGMIHLFSLTMLLAWYVTDIVGKWDDTVIQFSWYVTHIFRKFDMVVDLICHGHCRKLEWYSDTVCLICHTHCQKMGLYIGAVYRVPKIFLVPDTRRNPHFQWAYVFIELKLDRVHIIFFGFYWNYQWLIRHRKHNVKPQ